ncbi:MAG: hypothetical protein UY48_C0001G0033 [Candidatus Gottesmanbacteria bacterium GW2011_GWB1_49_7]|uniref:Glycosyltransferase n=1 Tax=Candidatus Gottesmanbacteria bacterium GW2011_GWB1_49_7 TaxID=1618448 RepID=A0A0G1YEJ8_9BACT|nr:MAG: hypothetical protein UY48_C0001G0033 [Candidatus Gottesmanbacteria bacterium GW2011_GWB1_49_7]
MNYEIDYEAWSAPKTFGFSGCFRLRNESQFMEAAIRSHLPWLDEAVLVVQPSKDDTTERAYRMAGEDRRIKVHEYPFECDWIDTPGFYAKDPDAPGHMVHMSNWAFTKCRYSWIVKVEGDVIATSTFADIVERVQAQPDKYIYYGRVVLNMAGEMCDMVSWDNPRNGGWDEAVVPNNPAYHFKRQDKWEVLQNPGEGISMGWSGLHMKRCKRGKTDGWNGETYIPFTREGVRSALAHFNRHKMSYPAADDPLGAECIYEGNWIEWYLKNLSA